MVSLPGKVLESGVFGFCLAIVSRAKGVLNSGIQIFLFCKLEIVEKPVRVHNLWAFYLSIASSCFNPILPAVEV